MSRLHDAKLPICYLYVKKQNNNWESSSLSPRMSTGNKLLSSTLLFWHLKITLHFLQWFFLTLATWGRELTFCKTSVTGSPPTPNQHYDSELLILLSEQMSGFTYGSPGKKNWNCKFLMSQSAFFRLVIGLLIFMQCMNCTVKKSICKYARVGLKSLEALVFFIRKELFS